MSDTRQRLLHAAIETVRHDGIAHTSARTIARRADANQALVFYHFGSVHGLLTEACLAATREQLDRWRPRLGRVETLDELVTLATELHREERFRGNVAVLAQMLAGAQSDHALREPTAAALELWVAEVRATLHRLLDDSPMSELVDVDALGRSLAAAFVGIELFDGIGDARTAAPVDALEQLASLVSVVLELGPVASTALRRRVERGRTRPVRDGER